MGRQHGSHDHERRQPQGPISCIGRSQPPPEGTPTLETGVKIILGSIVGVVLFFLLVIMGVSLIMISGDRNSLATEIGVLEFQRDGLLEERDSLSDDNSALSSDVTRLTGEKNSLTAERDALTGELRQAQSENDDVSRRLADAEGSVESLTSDLEEARESLSEANSELSSLTTTNNGLQMFRDSVQGFWGVSADKTLTIDYAFGGGSEIYPIVAIHSYRQPDPVFLVVEDISFLTSEEISSLNIVEALTWEESRTSLRFEVDLDQGRSTLTRGSYFASILFNVDTEFEHVTYLDFNVE